jgi:membrane protease YdiL (CAAX protease family)
LFGAQFAISAIDEMTLVFVYPLISILVCLVWLWLGGRWADRRKLADYGLHLNARWWQDFGFGLLLGGLLMTLIFLVEKAAGWVTITETFKHGPALPFWAIMLVGFWHFVAVGITEELVSRGYLLRNLAEGLNFKAIGPRRALGLAYFLSSALFGLFHFFNPNASTTSTILLVAAGLLLGLGFVLTGELAIPIGLHISWNFFQGRVFGFPVSGGQAGSTFIAIQQGGPTLWTGGDFGPEAGLIGLAAILLGCVLIVAWVKWRAGQANLQARLAAYQPQGTDQQEQGYIYS